MCFSLGAETSRTAFGDSESESPARAGQEKDQNPLIQSSTGVTSSHTAVSNKGNGSKLSSCPIFLGLKLHRLSWPHSMSGQWSARSRMLLLIPAWQSKHKAAIGRRPMPCLLLPCRASLTAQLEVQHPTSGITCQSQIMISEMTDIATRT